MDGGDVVTVVSVFVAGALSPWLAGRIAARAQDHRLKHERTLHDLDDLRRQFDGVGEALGHYMRAVAALTGPAEGDDLERLDAAYRRGSVAMERVAHLRFRLDEKDDAVVCAMEVLAGLDAIRWGHDELSGEEVQQRMLAVGDANTRFYRASKRWIETRITPA